MRYLSVLLLILLLVPFCLADMGVLDADEATIRLSIEGSLTLSSRGEVASVTEAVAELSWHPITTYNQLVVEKITSPRASSENSLLVYEWSNPSFGTHPFSLDATLQTNNDVSPVSRKISFPLQNLDPELLVYTQPSEMIDVNRDIRALASQLAVGKDDLYEVVFSLADWVTTNIDYDLNTLTVDATYPSSWVLENGYGVCDEMTSLFISMNRALGIPARFVSGLAYTNMEEIPTSWAGHGWAEVYFPDVGWVPFDVTYGEYGYIDAGHIRLKDSVDSHETSVEFSSRGRQFDLTSKPLNFDVVVLDESHSPQDSLAVSVEIAENEVAFGSYNLVTVNLENKASYYVSTRVDLGRTSDLEQIGVTQKNVLLKPYEEKTLSFIVRVSEALDSSYRYTFPVTVYTRISSPERVEFYASSGADYFDKSAFPADSVQTVTSHLVIDCSVPERVLIGDFEVDCSLSSPYDEFGRVCVGDVCDRINLADSEFSATLTKPSPGISTIPVIVESRSVDQTQYVTINVLDELALSIVDVSAPKSLSFDESAVISFFVERDSLATPSSSAVSISHEYFSHTWDSEDLQTKQEYSLTFHGRDLKLGENVFELAVDSVDQFGDPLRVTKEVVIVLDEVTLGQRLSLYLAQIDRWIKKLLLSEY